MSKLYISLGLLMVSSAMFGNFMTNITEIQNNQAKNPRTGRVEPVLVVVYNNSKGFWQGIVAKEGLTKMEAWIPWEADKMYITTKAGIFNMYDKDWYTRVDIEPFSAYEPGAKFIKDNQLVSAVGQQYDPNLYNIKGNAEVKLTVNSDGTLSIAKK